MTYQQCKYHDSIEKVPVRHIDGHSYVFLKDVQDCFPGIQRFTYDGNPIPFEHGKDNVRFKPERIQASIEKIIVCHKPIVNTEVHPKIDDNLTRKISEMHKDMKSLRNGISIIPQQILEVAEFTVPRLFIILPDESTRYKPARWFTLNYRLYFLCECENENERHFAFHDGYELKQPREFFRKYGSYLRRMLKIVKYITIAGSIIVPNLKYIAPKISKSSIFQDKIFWGNLNTKLDQLDEALTKAGVSENVSIEKNFQQYVEGAELRGIENFLKKTDDDRRFGNLYRTLTKDRHVRWVCIHHYDKDYANIKTQNLQNEFQELGGEIKGDVAIIQKQVPNQFLKIINILYQGLPMAIVTLKNLKLNKSIFDDLLKFFSQKTIIDKLKLENFKVSSFGFKLSQQEIISKLEDTIQKNNKLYIYYTFKIPLNKFPSILNDSIDAILKTSSRLIFQVQSQEDIPLLELSGTNKTGFILSINNSSENDDINCKTAIKNIFSIIPNMTKILLRNGIISESIWSYFHQFLTNQKTLQELTIDCRLTLEQTKDLYLALRNNTTLKILHMFNVWKEKDELRGFEEIFKILQMNNVLIEFTLKCHTDLLRLGFIARCLLQNKSLQILKLSKCRVYQNTDIELFKNFLQNTSIHTLSFESIGTHCETFSKTLATIVDNNKILEILELKTFKYSAISNSKNDLVCSSLTQKNNVCIFQYNIEKKNVALTMKLNFMMTQLGINRQTLIENNIQILVKVLCNYPTVTYLNLIETNISFNQFRQISDFLSNNRTLHVLDVSRCIYYSDYHLFIEEIIKLVSKNSFLKII